MRVLVSGGGIAGLTLAYWLHHYHIPVVVIEQAEHIRQDGYGLDFYLPAILSLTTTTLVISERIMSSRVA